MQVFFQCQKFFSFLQIPQFPPRYQAVYLLFCLFLGLPSFAVGQSKDDKTARVWSVGNGELLQILRPPIGIGYEGELGAVAISSMGEQVAVAGWTGFEWDKAASIYLSNLSTGMMQGRIRGVPQDITDLPYSVDGRELAAKLGKGGVSFYGPAFTLGKCQELECDVNYIIPDYSIDIDHLERSVTGSFAAYHRPKDYSTLAVKALLEEDGIQTILAARNALQIHLIEEDALYQNMREFGLVFTLEGLGDDGVGKLEYWVDDSDRASSLSPRGRGGLSHFEALTPEYGQHLVAMTEDAAFKLRDNEINATVNEAPTLYVLSVGISDYRDQSFNLNYAAADAYAFSTALEKQGINLYKKVVVYTLQNNEATLPQIGEAFEEIARQAQAQGVFVFYLAGHGIVADGRYHFIPYELIYENSTSLRQALTEAKVKELIASVEMSKRMMVIDSCHAGKAIPALAMLPQGGGISNKTAINRLMNATGIAILATATDKQGAIGGGENGVGHCLFTHVLLKGLSGVANTDKDKQIDVEELIAYTRKEVPRISLQKWHYEQFPMFQSPKQNFPISLVPE